MPWRSLGRPVKGDAIQKDDEERGAEDVKKTTDRLSANVNTGLGRRWEQKGDEGRGAEDVKETTDRLV
jgi:hypothetical protein